MAYSKPLATKAHLCASTYERITRAWRVKADLDGPLFQLVDRALRVRLQTVLPALAQSQIEAISQISSDARNEKTPFRCYYK